MPDRRLAARNAGASGSGLRPGKHDAAAARARSSAWSPGCESDRDDEANEVTNGFDAANAVSDVTVCPDAINKNTRCLKVIKRNDYHQI